MVGTDKNWVRHPPKKPNYCVKRAALRLPSVMVLPAKKLPMKIPTAPEVDMRALLNLVYSSVHPNFT